MRTATASTLSFMIVVGSAAFMLGGVGCQATTTNNNNGGSGGASAGGSGGNQSGGSGGSQTGGTGGSQSGGSGGNAGAGGSGGNGDGGAAGGGGSENGGAGGSAGSGEGGGGGGETGGASGSAGSSSGGSAGSQTGGAAGSAGSSAGGSAGSETGGSAGGGGSETGGSGGTGGVETGGSGGSGGSVPSTGCSNPITPNNGSDGGVTDFTDYSTSSGKWGNTSGLYGSIYSYQGDKGSTMKATVDTTAKNLHATGTVMAGDYGGFGITFNVCTTVAAFTQVQFTVAGSIGNCNLELQIKTFDQTPTTGDPPGGCDSTTTTCYSYPAFKQIAVPSTTAKDVAAKLSEFASWTTANAKQVVGLQWQVTSNSAASTGDAGAGCPIDVTITKIKFLP